MTYYLHFHQEYFNSTNLKIDKFADHYIDT